jgi:hypothetical protein
MEEMVDMDAIPVEMGAAAEMVEGAMAGAVVAEEAVAGEAAAAGSGYSLPHSGLILCLLGAPKRSPMIRLSSVEVFDFP